MAGLAMLFSRQILNGSQDFFFLFYTFLFIYFFKYAFLTLIILAIVRVIRVPSLGGPLTGTNLCVKAKSIPGTPRIINIPLLK